ncbi:hypothetical protein ACJ6WF_17485 [Streptomyces sp. MMS24-I2-30]|uniref:non-homologous end-joining DNA ligase LigD n=1 Tax=Streptomyces sp. MMS24-I2-30 TaxID=3351564 RepID=UPI003896EE64
MTFPQTSSAPMAIRSSKNKREGRLYLDVQRNAYAQTSVAPYAVRARVHAPVATPLDWDELDDPQLDPRRWTLRTLPDRLDTQGDPRRDSVPAGAPSRGPRSVSTRVGRPPPRPVPGTSE